MLETIFSLSNFLVIPFWFLMIFLPGWTWTGRVVGSVWVVAPAAALYLVLVLPDIAGVLAEVSNPDLPAIAASLGTDAGATVGWVHFLAFDLFVGRWAYLDARARQISPWLMAPVLFFIFMLGPIGFLLYLLLRLVYRRPGQAISA